MGLICLPLPGSAAYLGNTSTGNSTEACVAQMRGTVFTASANFIGQSIAVYFTASPPSVAAAIYTANQSTDLPETLLSSTNYTPASVGWNILPLAPAVAISSGQKYFLVFDVDNASAVGVSTDWSNPAWQKNADPPWPDPFNPDNPIANRSFCIYLSGPAATPTFTQTSIPTATFTRTPTPTGTSSPTPSISPTNTHTPTITLTVSVSATYTTSSTVTPVPQIILIDKVITYPSPAKGNDLWFYYTVAGPAQVRIELYNVVGEKGLVLTESHAASGNQRTRWDIRDVAPGIYFYRLRIEDAQGLRDFGVKKLVIIK